MPERRQNEHRIISVRLAANRNERLVDEQTLNEMDFTVFPFHAAPMIVGVCVRHNAGAGDSRRM
jgi:hypothetical protein